MECRNDGSRACLAEEKIKVTQVGRNPMSR